MNRQRLNALRARLAKKGLDGLLVTDQANIFYVSGFRGEGSLLILSSGRSYIITDPRFAEYAADTCGDFKIESVGGPGSGALIDLIKKRRIKSLGFESDAVSYRAFSKLKSSLRKTKLRPTNNIVEGLRIIKDARELSEIRKSVSILQKAYSYIRGVIRSGMTEEDLAAKIDAFLRSGGAEDRAFRTIVAGRPNSSHPHALASNRRLKNRGPILVDMGCVYKGYHSDLTRMFFMGKIGAKFKRIYNIVKTAQEKAIKKIGPWVNIRDIDNAARQHIESKGLGAFFLHSLGHGIGLKIHEAPAVSANSKEVFVPGMVFTVEPAVYIKGQGGVRVEDMVLVTGSGCEVLTKDIPK